MRSWINIRINCTTYVAQVRFNGSHFRWVHEWLLSWEESNYQKPTFFSSSMIVFIFSSFLSFSSLSRWSNENGLECVLWWVSSGLNTVLKSGTGCAFICLGWPSSWKLFQWFKSGLGKCNFNETNVWNCTIILAYVAGTSKFKSRMCCAASNGRRSIHLPIIRDLGADSYIKGFVLFSLL